MIRILVLFVFMCSASLATAQTGTYEQVFREGTLDVMPEDGIIYRQEVVAIADPERAPLENGQVRLAEIGDDIVELKLTRDEQFKTYGRYPRSVGNPLAMVIGETVTRDMARLAGGSPFYIRNRIKASMIELAEISTGTLDWNGATIPTQTVVLRPFLNDPNRERMLGWEDLEIAVTTSEELPGWYYQIEARAISGGQTIYRRTLTLEEE